MSVTARTTPPDAARSAGLTSSARRPAAKPGVLARLTLVEGRIFLREPSALFFGLVFPGLLLTVLGLVMPWADMPFSDTDPVLSQVTAITGYTPIVLAMAIATVAFSTLPATLATYREKGVLRRLSTTPLPPSRVLVAQLLVNLGVLIVASVLAVVAGVLVLDVALPTNPVLLVGAFLLGAASSISVGCLIAARAPTAAAGTGIGMLTFFVSLFFAGVWMPLPLMPQIVQTISAYTPVGAASQALGAGWYGGPFPGLELLVMVGWTVVCVPLAAKLFRWS